MNPQASRRNGKPASCEPCRKAKIKCDHTRPICHRCRRRKIADRCYYHPNPLSRRQAFSEPSAVGVGGPTASIGESLGSPTASAFGLRHAQDRDSAAFVPDARHVEFIAHALRLLRHLPLIERLLDEYYTISQAALVPGPIMRALTAGLRQAHDAFAAEGSTAPAAAEADEDDRMGDFAANLFRSALTPLQPTADMTFTEFSGLYTGDNLRIETLGLVYAVAARSQLSGLARDDVNRDDFVDTLFRASTECLAVARESGGGVNDVVIWLTHENLLLSVAVSRLTDPVIWRRVGDLASDIFTMGLHRESGAPMPFFLAECRRRSFAAAYQLDKAISTFFDRPPTILRRYSDCKMPLDLSDEELLGSRPDVDEACSRLSPEGWNAQNRCSSATWVRIRFMLGVFREEALQFPYLPLHAENIEKLKALSARSQQTWYSLPEHLRYSKSCWGPDTPPSVCLMLTVTYLSHLQTEFLIYTMLGKGDVASASSLLRAAADTLSTVLQLGVHQDRAIYIRRDFTYILLTYGLPSGLVLTSALRTHRGVPDISRAMLVHNLSVLLSHLETACPPNTANHDLFQSFSRVFFHSLDQALLPPPVGANTADSSWESMGGLGTPNQLTTTPAQTAETSSLTPITESMPNFAALPLLNLDDLGVSDMLQIQDSVDWTTNGVEWNIL